MIFNEKTISLKDGRTAVLRSPRPGEGQAMIDYVTKACGETEFLMRCPEECADITVESEEKWIADAIASPDKLIITCFIDGKPVGNCDIRFNTRIKACHRSTIGIGILKEYWNLGIGSAMMAELVAAATERGVRFVELGFVLADYAVSVLRADLQRACSVNGKVVLGENDSVNIIIACCEFTISRKDVCASRSKSDEHFVR